MAESTSDDIGSPGSEMRSVFDSSDEECDDSVSNKSNSEINYQGQDDQKSIDNHSNHNTIKIDNGAEIEEDRKEVKQMDLAAQSTSCSETASKSDKDKTGSDAQSRSHVGKETEFQETRRQDVNINNNGRKTEEDNKSTVDTPQLVDQQRPDNSGDRNLNINNQFRSSAKFEIGNDEEEIFLLLNRIFLYCESNDVLKSVKRSLRFDEEKKEIYIYYSDEEQLDEVKQHLYVIRANAHRVCLTGCMNEITDFLSSPVGIDVADNILVKNKIAATVSTNSRQILAQDEIQGGQAEKLIYEAVGCEKVTIDETITAQFLQSKRYEEGVAALLQGKRVTITLNESLGKISIIGVKKELQDVRSQVIDFLNKNKELTVKVEAEVPVLQLLQLHHMDQMREDIKKCSTEEGCAVELRLEASNISLKGLKSDTEAAQKFLEINYIQRVKKEKFEITQPGVRIENFHMPDTEEGKLIAKLNQKHSAYIDVEETTVEEVVNLSNSPTGDEGKSSDGYIKTLREKGLKSALKLACNNSGIFNFGAAKSQSSSPSTISLVKGNITEFKDADVLVNPLATSSSSLAKCGAVAKGFSSAGGPQLEEEVKKVGLPGDFGSGVTVTMATGSLTAKKIFHVAIRSHKNERSDERLLKLITNCLNQAVQEGLSSIAFPTVGCGRLNYDPAYVAKAFSHAVGETKANLKVYIVCFPDGPYDVFDQIFNQTDDSKSKTDSQTASATATASAGDARVTGTAASTTAAATGGAPSIGRGKKSASSDSSAKSSSKKAADTTMLNLTRRTLCFHIYSLNESAATNICAKLIKFFQHNSKEKRIEAKYWELMSAHYQQKILSLNSVDVTVSWDETTHMITIKGTDQKRISKAKDTIKEILEQEEQQGGLERIKKAEGVKEYLKAISYLEETPYPSYWKQIKDPANSRECKMTDLNSQSHIYKAVEEMIMSTWDASKVGIGSDAKGLTPHDISITKISVVENPELFRQYFNCKKALCGKAARSLFTCFNGLNKEPEVLTVTNLSSELMEDNQLTSEINEYYFLHGTAKVHEISHTGLDFRFSGDKVMFGRGAYLAESSTKADQYADKRDSRSAAGTKLYMFVVRMPLGEPHVTKEPYDFHKPPCADQNCRQLDRCIEPTHGQCDSVVGVQRWRDRNQRQPGSDTDRLLFREFIAYDKQCYPDFLVEYVRI